MRILADDLGFGGRWAPLAEGRGFGHLSLSNIVNGDVTHMAVCPCAGCLSKIQIEDDLPTTGGTNFNGSQVPTLAALTGGGPQFAGDDIADDITTTTNISVGGTLNSSIQSSGDLDFIRITLTAGQTYTFSLDGVTILDPYLELRDATGAIVAFNDDGGIAYDSFLMYRPTSSGTYYIVARGFDGTQTGTYSLTVDDVVTGQTSPTTFVGNSLPYFSWEEAAIQISRSGASWASSFNTPTVVTYAYRSSAPTTMPDDTAGFSQFSAAQIAATELALQAWAAVANITFVRVDDGSGYSNNAAILFGNYSSGADGAAAFAYLPSTGNTAAASVEGDVWVNISLSDNSNLTAGGYGHQVLLHEIGHALGLSHPGDYNAGQGTPTYPGSAVFYGDTRMFSIMSYFASSNTGGLYNNFASMPAVFDIAAIQRLYGANTSTRTGDTTYGFNSNTGRAEYTLTFATQQAVFAIWDGGGNDTLDFSGYSESGTIDLREESFSSVGPRTGGTQLAQFNVSIAHGVTIENAIGGSGDDIIIGNDANNTLTGNGGFDNLSGGAGNDRLVGGASSDTLNGGAGIDTAGYSIASTSATWVRNANGTWTVSAGADGTDTVTSVEFLDFTDRDVFLDRAYSTFSGDGTSDVFMRHSTGAMGVWFVNGAGVTGAAGLGAVALSWAIEGVADFNGDGRDDIFMRNSNGNLGVWFMNGASASGAAGLGNIDLAWDIAGLGDLNGDGFDDIVMWNANGSLGVWFMNNGAVSGAAGLGNISRASWTFEGLGDFNGDGRDDILWRNSAGDTGIWFMNGGAATGAGIGNIAPGWAIEGVGDFNGDGRDDILMRDASGNLGVWFMNGASATGAGLGNVAQSFAVAAVGDYNGDGRDDILWWNDNGNLGVWFMNGAAATATGYGNVSHDWIINPGG